MIVCNRKRKTAIVRQFLRLVVAISVCFLCGKLFFFNKFLFIVSSSSMEPEYNVGTLVVAEKTPFELINVGDVIIFKSNALNGGLAFHRVYKVTEDGVYTKGDNNNLEDNQLIDKTSYIAKGVNKNYTLGRLILFIKTPLSLILLFIILGISCVTVSIIKKKNLS